MKGKLVVLGLLPILISAQFALITQTTGPSSSNSLQTQGSLTSMPASTQTVLTTLTTSSTGSSSSCGANEVSNNQNICIKPNYIQGCEIYQSSKECFKCSTGYLLNTNKVCDYDSSNILPVTHIIGCIKQSSNACDICGSGFYKKDNKCQLGIKNCASYDNQGACIGCEQQYSLVLSQCRHNNLLGCKYQTTSHTCQQCYPPFQISGQQCDIQQCRILNDYGCVACECGYYLTLQRTCSEVAPGCLRYQKGICKDCLPHYKLKGGVCEIQGCLEYASNWCKKCSDNYMLEDGQCKFKNCFDWLNNQCTSCQSGYSVKNGICQKQTTLSCS